MAIKITSIAWKTIYHILHIISWFIIAFVFIIIVLSFTARELLSGIPVIRELLEVFTSIPISAFILYMTFLLAAAIRTAEGFVDQENFIIAAEKMSSQTEKLESYSASISRAAEEIKAAELTTTKKALSLIGEFLRLETSGARTDDLHTPSSHAAMEAIACNLRNWERQIESHYNGGRGDKFLTEVWIRSQAAYFLEEGFDVGKKTLATNGRNLCFIILAALDALMELGNREGKIVHYTAVTPVNPKDWYNWPHGIDGKDKKYYENRFIGDYYRILREIVRASGEKLKHQRYILCQNSNEETKNDCIISGWPLDSSKDMLKSLQGEIIPCSIPRNEDIIADSKGPSFGSLSNLAHKYGLINNDAAIAYVPIDCWNQIDQSIFNTFEKKVEILSASQKYFLDKCKCALAEFENDLANLPPPIDEILTDVCYICRDLLDNIKLDSSGRMNTKDRENIIKWLRLSHRAEAHIAGFIVGEGKDRLQNLRYYILRYLDYYNFDNEQTKIYEVFSHQIHSSPSDCFIASLEKDVAENLFSNEGGVESEFHLFGFSENRIDVKWKLCVTAVLKNPFDVTLLKLEDNYVQITRYINVLDKLAEKSCSMEAFVNIGRYGAEHGGIR